MLDIMYLYLYHVFIWGVKGNPKEGTIRSELKFFAY